MATILGDVQYSQVMGQLPTPVETSITLWWTNIAIENGHL